MDREKVRKGLEWILDGDRFGFGENWHIDSEPKCEEEQAGYNIQRAIELLKEHGWIPVEERLPEEAYGCLVTVWDSKPNGGDDFPNILPYFVGWDGEQWNDSDGERCPFEVIAWIKLPKPYQPKD